METAPIVDVIAAGLIAARMANRVNARKYAVRIVLSNPTAFGIEEAVELEDEQVHVHRDSDSPTLLRVTARRTAASMADMA